MWREKHTESAFNTAFCVSILPQARASHEALRHGGYMTVGGTNMTAGHYTQLALDFNRYCGEPWSVHAEQCSRYECQAVGGSWINRRWNFGTRPL